MGQTKITVLDGFMGNVPMEDVVVLTDERKELGVTDSNGNFTVPRGINRVILFHQGYQERTLVLYGKDIEIQLKPITVELGVSQITSNDTEARNLIRQVIQNKRKNSIENLKSYEYKSYSKFLLTASTDSMPYILFPIISTTRKSISFLDNTPIPFPIQDFVNIDLEFRTKKPGKEKK